MLTTREIITAAMHKEAQQIIVGTAVRTWLAANEGKKLTKRNKPDLITTATAAWSGSDEVRLWPGYIGLELYSSEYKRTDCKEGFLFRIGEGECPIISTDYFDQHNLWLAAAIQTRQPTREATLATDKPEQIDAAVATYVEAREALKSVVSNLEESYEVRRQLGDRRYEGLELQIAF